MGIEASSTSMLREPLGEILSWSRKKVLKTVKLFHNTADLLIGIDEVKRITSIDQDSADLLFALLRKTEHSLR